MRTTDNPKKTSTVSLKVLRRRSWRRTRRSPNYRLKTLYAPPPTPNDTISLHLTSLPRLSAYTVTSASAPTQLPTRYPLQSDLPLPIPSPSLPYPTLQPIPSAYSPPDLLLSRLVPHRPQRPLRGLLPPNRALIQLPRRRNLAPGSRAPLPPPARPGSQLAQAKTSPPRTEDAHGIPRRSKHRRQ